MPNDCISYQNSGYFTALIVDYLNQKEDLKNLYGHFPTLDNFEKQIQEKQVNFKNENRKTLVDVLKKQYLNTKSSVETSNNIEILSQKNTFTITTGHQLNLFSGPLYFLYKIVSTINLTNELKTKYPDFNFVPIYWMATEDHDFEEINYFNFNEKKIRWNAESTGPVGRLATDGLKEVFEVFSNELRDGDGANELRELFKDAYINNSNLAEATRFLANSLFGNYGLVILDADDSNLKCNFSPFIKNELENQSSFNNVTESIKSLKNYPIQVNPREINLFYMEDNFRERIVKIGDLYVVNNTKISFTKTEILEELKRFPKKFSPNVILRPLYQEVILPNLCYIGGGGEIAYWLEFKSNFDGLKVTFPILLLRNSVMLITEKQSKKADKLDLSVSDLFLKQSELINKKVKEFSEIEMDFSAQKNFLAQQFENLEAVVSATDSSFLGAVIAQRLKQTKGLDNLEKRLLKAQKLKYQDQIERIVALQNQLFPNQSLQERQANFSQFYEGTGNLLIEKLISDLHPLEPNFSIITV